MSRTLLPILVALIAWSLSAQPQLFVDAAAARHPISPYVYGINWYADYGLGSIMRVPLRRWGGDNTTPYNWQLDVSNSGGDWYFENGQQYNGVGNTPPGQNSFHIFHEYNLSLGSVSLGSIPLMDWVAKSNQGCSFSVAKYGKQYATDPYNPDCGNGMMPDNQTPLVNVTQTDPNDTYQPVDETFAQAWVQSLIATYGASRQGGVRMWSMDNEPEWWFGVHSDIYKNYASFDDMWKRNLRWATAVKKVDPKAMITGPVPAGWSGMLYSRVDMQSGWSTSPWQYWDNPTDQKAHGGLYWVPYYLSQMKQFEDQNGYRLLDVLDVHGYITPGNLTDSSSDASTESLRMTSTRGLWDPNYIVPGTTLQDNSGNQVAPQLIRRMHQWVDTYYPGTKLAITEYMWHALGSITGAVTQADILGIFGREELDYGTLWGPPKPTDPGAFAFKIFLNYDGAGNQFGETSVSCSSSDPDTLSLYAAQRSDSALTVLVLNKTTSDVTTDTISLASFTPAGTAQVWQYSSKNLSAIVKEPDVNVSGSGMTASFPALSMTLLVIPQAQSAMTVPQPVINSVNNAASYDYSGVSPGEIVTIFGKSLGPATLQSLQVDSNQVLTTSIGGVRVLFDGLPAPMVYAASGAVSAVVPYEIGTGLMAPRTMTQVQVEYQGNRSDPVTVPLMATRPGIFTDDTSGSGQGAILNNIIVGGKYQLNTASTPARAGSAVMIYATGEGLMNPPGVSGLISQQVLRKPLASCKASIGGLDAQILYCGAAPDAVGGLVQINAQIPAGVSGIAVPVTVTFGGVASQAGVTVAVQ